MLDVLTQGDIYSGFTFVLGFSLVFRTSQSYLRYWTAATSVHEMGSEWSDSCASLIAFSTISKRPLREIMRFRHTMVRLYSLLHAMALEEIASVSEDLPLLDVEGFSKDQLLILTSGLAQGRKVPIVLSWIKAYIIQMAESGILSVPPPILTRVFQEMGAGLVNYHKAQQIVIWPFPFPYTQLNLLLIQIYTILTPLVVCTWGTWSWLCAIFTFISVTCMIGLDLIASELENPFGEDPNDLPVADLQRDFNKGLLMQLNPATSTPPDLLPTAVMDYRELAVDIMAGRERTSRLLRSDSRMIHTASTQIRATLSSATRSDRLRPQLRWCGQVGPDSEVHRLQHWLKCLPSQTQEALHEAVRGSKPREAAQRDLLPEGLPERKICEEPEASSASLFSAGLRDERYSSEASSEAGQSSQACQRKAQDAMHLRRPLAHLGTGSEPSVRSYARRSGTLESPAMEPVLESPPWSEFLTALHSELREHLQSQLEVQRRELGAIEGMLARANLALSPGARQRGHSPPSLGRAEDSSRYLSRPPSAAFSSKDSDAASQPPCTLQPDPMGLASLKGNAEDPGPPPVRPSQGEEERRVML